MRININYHIDEECCDWAKKVNAEISKLTKNEIDFSSNKIRPHITLLMGEIEEKNLQIVQNIVNNFNATTIGTNLVLSRPYSKGEYVFADVKNVKNIIKDYNDLLERLKDFIVPHKHSISAGGIPHLTLGFTKDTDKLTKYINSINTVPKATICGLSADLTGQHGTVICDPINESLCTK